MAKKSEALAEVIPGVVTVRPDFVEDSSEGKEHITSADVFMPRLSLAQAMSPQTKKMDSAYIDGLGEGDMFNSVSGENYGNGPLYFQVLKGSVPRGIEFNPREEGGGVREMNVDKDDPRMKWGPKGEPPVATLFYEFVIMLVKDSKNPELIMLSLKSTGVKVAKLLNSLITQNPAPIHSVVYSVKSVMVTAPKGTYAAYTVVVAGWASGEIAARGKVEFDRLATLDVQSVPDTTDDEVEETLPNEAEM